MSWTRISRGHYRSRPDGRFVITHPGLMHYGSPAGDWVAHDRTLRQRQTFSTVEMAKGACEELRRPEVQWGYEAPVIQWEGAR